MTFHQDEQDVDILSRDGDEWSDDLPLLDEIDDPAIAAIEERSVEALAAAGELVITTDNEYVAAGEFLTETIKPLLHEIDETFAPVVTAAHRAHRAALAARKTTEQPLLDAETAVKASMVAYHTEQERVREEAERERLAAAKREAEDRAVEEAARLETEHKHEQAEDRLRQPMTPVVVAPLPELPKVAGVSMKTTYAWTVENESKIDRKFLTIDRTKISKTVRAMGVDAEALVGGIVVFEQKSAAAKGSK